MLAQTWHGQDVANWWISEKLDGCRAFWDGFCLRTRQSWNVIACPPSLTVQLPRGVALDGELWAGRGTFQQTRVLVQTNRPTASEWQQTRFCVFDAPTCDAMPVEQRFLIARDLARGERVEWVEQRRVRDTAEARTEMDQIVRDGGEGVMLRRPSHCYKFDRSRDWLKLKPAGVD